MKAIEIIMTNENDKKRKERIHLFLRFYGNIFSSRNAADIL